MTLERSKITLLPTGDAARPAGRQHDASDASNVSYQRSLNRVALAMSSDLAQEELLNEIVAGAMVAMGADIGLIRSVSADGHNFVVASVSTRVPISINGLIGSYSVIADELADAAPFAASNLDLNSDEHATEIASTERWEFEDIGAQYLLMTPLVAQGRLVGRIDLLRITDEPFSSESEHLVLPFASFAANALIAQQLARESEEGHVYQTVVRLHESVEQLADPQTILQAVVELIVREPGCARCYAMLWNSDRNEFVPTAVAGLEPHLVDILKLISLSPQVVPAFDQMVHSSRPLVIADATRSTLLPASLVRALGIRAAMIVPLRGRRNQIAGVLILDESEEGIQFTDTQATTIAEMAQHLSPLIEHAIMFDEMRTASDSMAIINEIAIQLAMLTDNASIFRQLYVQIGSILDASRFAMALLTNDRQSLDVHVAIDGEIIEGTSLVPLGDDPLSMVASSGRAELVGIRSGADTSDWLPGVNPAEPSHSHLTVPITVGRNVIGVLTVQSMFRNAYGPRDREILTAIALHTGIAIENARLYRIVQSRGDRRAVVLDEVIHRQEIERKELVDEIHDDTLQTLAACLYRLDQAQTAVDKLNQQDPALIQISDVRDSLAQNIDRLRQRVFALRPATLDRLGLAPALREFLGRVAREHGIETDLDVGLPSRLTPENETLVYRLVQEATDVITARDGATTISVRIREHGSDLLIAIHDDAVQPQTQADDENADVGLLALVERAELAGGHVRLARRAAGGTLMQIQLPITGKRSVSSEGERREKHAISGSRPAKQDTRDVVNAATEHLLDDRKVSRAVRTGEGMYGAGR